jgi:hypothetical protein
MSENLKKTLNKIFRDKLKIANRRKAARNETTFRRRSYDPI